MLVFFIFCAQGAILQNELGVRVLATEGMGKGLFAAQNIKKGEKVFCVNESLALHSDDPNFLLEYVLDLSDIERLKAYLLYHRFVLKHKSAIFEYLDFIGSDQTHPVYYSESELHTLSSISEYIDITPLKSLKKGFKTLSTIFSKLKDMPKSLTDFSSYLWVSEIVMSRSFVSYNTETKDYSYLFIPYIDLANYWPVEKPKNFSNELFLEAGQYCLLTPKDLNTGDQIFVDYSFSEFSKFFINFGFVVEKDPKLYFSFHLPFDSCENCTFALKHFEVNWEMLQRIMQSIGSDYSPELEFRRFLPVIKDLPMFQDVLSGLMIYRLELVSMIKTLKVGIRELRRLAEKSFGRKEKIVKGGVGFRVLAYSHLESLEQEILYSFYSYLF